MLLGGILSPLYAAVYEMPQISVKGKKLKKDVSSIETIQNGFKTQSVRHIDQGQLRVYMDGIPIQNGCLPINLALFDKSANNSTDHSVGDVLFSSEKPNDTPKLECHGAYGSFNTYKGSAYIEGGTPTTQAGLRATQTGMNGRPSLARRYQSSLLLKGSDQETRRHITARLDHQAKHINHTISVSHHDGIYTYKALPFTDFDVKHPRWQAKEEFEHVCYQSSFKQAGKTHGILAGYAQQKRQDTAQDDFIKNSFDDENLFIQQTNAFTFNAAYTLDLNIAYLFNAYRSDFSKNHVNQFQVENNHHIKFKQTQFKIHLKGVHTGVKNNYLDADASIHHPLYAHFQIFSKIGMYHRPPLMAQKFHPLFKNPDLMSERAITIDGGYQFANKKNTFKQSIFLIHIKNYIDLIGQRYENARSLQTYGIESRYAYVCAPWRMTTQHTYARIQSNKDAFLCRKPKHKANIEISYAACEKLTITASVDYFGPHQDRGSFQEPLINCPSISTLNVGLDYQYTKATKIFCKVDNLLNKKYEFPQGYGGKPLFISVGLNISFCV
ncbi:MAG: Vitamin B12 transporter BtuB [Holosporales bacterium]